MPHDQRSLISASVGIAAPGGSSPRSICATVEADKVRGTFIDPNAGRMLFGTYAEQRLRTVRLDGSTRETVEYRVRKHLLPFFGQRQLGAIKPGTIREWDRSMEGRLALSTRSVVFAHLRTILNAAVDDQKIAKSSSPNRRRRRSCRGRSSRSRWSGPGSCSACPRATGNARCRSRRRWPGVSRCAVRRTGRSPSPCCSPPHGATPSAGTPSTDPGATGTHAPRHHYAAVLLDAGDSIKGALGVPPGRRCSLAAAGTSLRTVRSEACRTRAPAR